jgi:hypothetical protein
MIGCCLLLGIHPFDRKRVFARWAKAIFWIVAGVGICVGSFSLAWDSGRFVFSEYETQRIDGFLSFARGLMLGGILSLVSSGQLTGTKK